MKYVDHNSQIFKETDFQVHVLENEKMSMGNSDPMVTQTNMNETL